jgi:superfamily I DNA and/or RNA helicase
MYAAQVEEIKRQLGALGVLHQEGKAWVAPEDERYARGEDGQPLEVDGKNIERLAVGTVDAFQGREFDVVFVSLVRCNTRPTPRLRFGHVAMPNRLNVAMSRQRSLLVVCGDRQTFLEGEAASWPDAAPLRAFDALCSRTPAPAAGVSR